MFLLLCGLFDSNFCFFTLHFTLSSVCAQCSMILWILDMDK